MSPVSTARSLIGPLAVPTRIPKHARDVPALWEVGVTPRTAEVTPTLNQHASPLNEDGIDVRIPMHHDLLQRDSPSYERDIPTPKGQGIELQPVVTQRTQLESCYPQDWRVILLARPGRDQCGIDRIKQNQLIVGRPIYP